MLVLLGAIAGLVRAQDKAPARLARPTVHFAAYDSEPRLANGHVDCDALLARLRAAYEPAKVQGKGSGERVPGRRRYECRPEPLRVWCG